MHILCTNNTDFIPDIQTVSALISFVMLMALHPDVQQKAQQEIDEFIGCRSIPSPEDCERLPYLTAVLKEVLRFAPVGPLGECKCV